MTHDAPLQPPAKTIAELASVIPGFSPKPSERKKAGRYLLLGGRNIKEGKLVTTAADSYIDVVDRESFRRAIAKPGDVIVSTLFDRRKLYRYEKNDPPAVVNGSCAIIRAGRESDYIISYLRTEQGASNFLTKATKATAGALIRRVSVQDLGAIQIPILPVEQLARLGDARIEKASTKELLATQRELASKNAEVEQLRAENKRLAQFYDDRARAVSDQLATNSLATRIKHGETARMEFKSSLRWNIKAQKHDREIENAALKAIVAFCNTHGGELLIGVADDQTIVGVEHDGFANEDKFLLHLRQLLAERVAPTVADIVAFQMVTVDGKRICQVTCTPSKHTELWLRPDKQAEKFYVRLGPSSTELSPREAAAYIRKHFDAAQH